MTAAALRPELLTHLFATQRRPPEKSDIAAGAVSFLLHAGLAGAVVWASATLTPEVTRETDPTPMPIFIATPGEKTSGGGSEGGGGRERRTIVAPPRFEAPIPELPPASTHPVEPWAPAGEPPPGARDYERNTGGGGGTDVETRDGFRVLSVPPRLVNANDVQRALERNYPPLLRDAQIGGRVVLWLLIDENGRVMDAEVKESSGQSAFDDAAIKVGEIMKFSPGMNRTDRVKVWVQLPIVFKTR